MHHEYGCLSDAVIVFNQIHLVLEFAKFSKRCDHQMADVRIVELIRIAGDQEHVESDPLLKHLFSCDSVTAERQKYPRNVQLDGLKPSSIDIANLFMVLIEIAKQVHDASLNQNIDAVLIECEVNQCLRGVKLDFNLSIWISAVV